MVKTDDKILGRGTMQKSAWCKIHQAHTTASNPELYVENSAG